MNERILKLQQQVKELLAWKQERLIQQIQFNPPVNTTTLMHQNHFEMENTLTFSPTVPIAIEVLLDETIYYIPAFTHS